MSLIKERQDKSSESQTLVVLLKIQFHESHIKRKVLTCALVSKINSVDLAY